jgi:prepilin-type N-terminal cleavage/methylation domain-containing protein
MIYLYGKNKGFTLLEVLIGIVIFSVVFTVLIRIQSENISGVYNSIRKVKALNFFKEKYYNIKSESPDFRIEKKQKDTVFGLKEINYTIIDRKTKKPILDLKTYEE